MFHTYILYSKSLDKYYVGYTSETVEARVQKHLSSNKGFTSRAKDWEIRFIESFEIKSHAIKREKQIKSWKSRKKIEALMTG